MCSDECLAVLADFWREVSGRCFTITGFHGADNSLMLLGKIMARFLGSGFLTHHPAVHANR